MTDKYTLPEPSRSFLCTKCGGRTPTPETFDAAFPSCSCGYSMFVTATVYPLSEVQAAYAAGLAEGRKVPEGWKLVPIEPTREMAAEGCSAHAEAERRIEEPGAWERGGFAQRIVRTRFVYAAMLAAAPEYKP